MLKHYYRLVYWKRRLTRAIPGAGLPVRIRRRRVGWSAGRFRPLMVFGAIVLIAVAVSYGIGTWETSRAPQPVQQTDLQAVCEQRLGEDCPGAARDTCRELLAEARRGGHGDDRGDGSGSDGGPGQSLAFVRCGHAG